MPQAGINDERDMGAGASISASDTEAGNGTQPQIRGDQASNSPEIHENTGSEARGDQVLSESKDKFSQAEIDVLKNYVQSAQEQDIVAYNGFYLKQIYPKAYNRFVEVMQSKSSMGEMDEETVLGVLLYSPRTIIFNVFDELKLYVIIAGYDTDWHYSINGELATLGFKSRTKAEVSAFEYAFAQLEKQLNSNI